MMAVAGSPHAWFAVGVFAVAYLLVVLEDKIHLRKSKPVLAAAGVIWVLVAYAFRHVPDVDEHYLEDRLLGHVGEYGALFLFLMVAMAYLSAISKHNVFLRLNAVLISAGFGMRTLYWTLGGLAFFISPICDNMTTALLMGSVAIAVSQGNKRFVAVCCSSIVVAANAGGVFSPFGDITSLMVWQAGKVDTGHFLKLFVPSLVNWLVPAIVMSFTVPKDKPAPLSERVSLKPGWWVVCSLFLATIGTAVFFYHSLHLPPFLGMTSGLAYYFVYAYVRNWNHKHKQLGEPLDVFADVATVEWDAMLFFFGVMMCVGGLTELGVMAKLSGWLYSDQVGPFYANVGIGVASALIDNVSLMFAVLNMDPNMGTGERGQYYWELLTLTAGTGGSLLSIGSAAGVSLMGLSKGRFTFGDHLRWFPAILAGFCASVIVHWWLNSPPSLPGGAQ
ncbi:MAG: sodium:proton antiporter NhaD [Planctomycetes bacterium]|nr:sodium:proton antiporter NhaD [Planctomycetota bacterium]